MPRRTADSPNWGGKRKGAGRPKLEDGCRVQVAVRLKEETAEQCKALGGATWIRTTLEEAIERRAAKPHSANTPGFDAVAPERFARPADSEEPEVAFVDMRVACGFPSPAMDYATDQLSLSELMIRNELSTFFAVATGDSMADAGIQEGDTLILDRAIEPRSGDVVLAFLRGEFTLKRLHMEEGKVELRPENAAADYPVITPTEYDDFSIEGVLTGLCRKMRK